MSAPLHSARSGSPADHPLVGRTSSAAIATAIPSWCNQFYQLVNQIVTALALKGNDAY
jgi:hypothetical protein